MNKILLLEDDLSLIGGLSFARLTGITDYSLVMIQITKDATDEDVAAIGNVVGENTVFNDRRDQRTTGTYIAFLLLYDTLITAHFSYAIWSVPVVPLVMILLF